MKHTTILALLGASSLSVSAQEPLIAKIGDIELRRNDLREAVAALPPAEQKVLEESSEALTLFVRQLLVRRLVLREADAKQWDKQPEVISQLVRSREETIVETFLNSASRPDPAYPSDSEVEAAYLANKDRLLVPKSYRIAQIYVAAPPPPKDGKDEAPPKLRTVLQKLAEKGADFAVVAKTLSEDTSSAPNGGEIGWLTEAQLQPAIRSVIPDLERNRASQPIRLDDGWHILKVLEISEPRTPELKEVRDGIVTNLRTAKTRMNRQRLLESLLEKNPPAINEIELMKQR